MGPREAPTLFGHSAGAQKLLPGAGPSRMFESRAPYKIHVAHLKHGLFHQNEGTPPLTSCNVQVYFMHPDPC